MSRCHQVAPPMARCLRHGLVAQVAASSIRPTSLRLFSNTASQRDVEPTTSPSSFSTDAAAAAALASAGLATATPGTTEDSLSGSSTDSSAIKRPPPVGSIRQRVAIRQTPSIPFEQLPYHCFQEARKILKEDRDQKLVEIKKRHEKVKRIQAMPAETYRDGQHFKSERLSSLRKELEGLKIQADINDPLVKRKFEDGQGDLSKPIYRFLARRKWESMAYKILVQRVQQFHITPDVLPEFDPKMDVQLTFRNIKIQPGEIVDSLITETPPNLRVQVFHPEEHLVSIVVMDSDVPDPENDAFTSRLHFVASNIPISSLTKNISLIGVSRNPEGKLAVPWLPPTAQEGAPYHRLSVWILKQKWNRKLNVDKLKEFWEKNRDGFELARFIKNHDVSPIGFNIFRSVWDQHTRQVMQRHGIPGADIVFRNKRYRTLKTPKKARGWEARRQGPGWRHMWKYTKRIAKNRGGT